MPKESETCLRHRRSLSRDQPHTPTSTAQVSRVGHTRSLSRHRHARLDINSTGVGGMPKESEACPGSRRHPQQGVRHRRSLSLSTSTAHPDINSTGVESRSYALSLPTSPCSPRQLPHLLPPRSSSRSHPMPLQHGALAYFQPRQLQHPSALELRPVRGWGFGSALSTPTSTAHPDINRTPRHQQHRCRRHVQGVGGMPKESEACPRSVTEACRVERGDTNTLFSLDSFSACPRSRT